MSRGAGQETATSIDEQPAARKPFDSSAIGSDVARSRAQYLARAFAKWVVKLLGLNGSGALPTEIVQAIHPVAAIPTAHGTLYCRCGHGRLRWRAQTFHTEEPQTIEWLDSLGPDDVLWDVGANVGLYAIYAARFRGCRVFAFEPESQNYALLVENIALNGAGDRCLPVAVALAEREELGHLHIRYVTKGGAYNLFTPVAQGGGNGEPVPESIRAARGGTDESVVRQLVVGMSADDLVRRHGLPVPTHLKIDVDGLEPKIISGAPELLSHPTLRSILIEINRRSAADLGILEILAGHGFRLARERSNWLSRTDRTREADMPATNMIFVRAAGGPPGQAA